MSSLTCPVAQLPATADVVVIGSGAAGMVAACRAVISGKSVVILEKAQLLGGTTSMGGGVIWAPANSLAAAAGYSDSKNEAIQYLSGTTHGKLSEEDIITFVDTISEAIDFLQYKTQVQLIPLARPDYRPDQLGAAEGGRSLDNAAFKGAPELMALLRPSSYFPPLTMVERDNLNGRAPDPKLLEERHSSGARSMGGALVGALLATVLEYGAKVSTSARVTAIRPFNSGWEVKIRGRHAIQTTNVVLASGGFDWDPQQREAYHSQPYTPISAPSNEGDGLKLGLQLGGQVDSMTTVWGVPVITPPQQQYDSKPSGRMGNVEMTLPGSITVNRFGQRFLNEATNYHDASQIFGNTSAKDLAPENQVAWLIVDQDYRDKYPIAGYGPGGKTPEWMYEADTPEALAELIGVPPQTLAEQIARFNESAVRGEDPEFGRGSSAQDRFLGDNSNKPNPVLRPLTQAPFTAVRLQAGMLGTSGGFRTNAHAQVIGHNNQPIKGLYAAGNVAASIFRGAYPGGGATLASAVARGYAAGSHIAMS